jgi:signal peptidase I
MKNVLSSLALLVLLSVGLHAAVPAGAAAAPISPLDSAQAYAEAQRLAARSTDLSVLLVRGQSMHPYFSDGSVLVVKAAKAAQLRPGIVAVYQNRFGEVVAHRIERATAEGWVARGANNATADSTRVTDANLIGTVYTTFYAAASGHASIAALTGAPVALAAAAK